MSILQEYETIRKQLGEETYKKIEEYLNENPDLFLSDVYYKSEVYAAFKKWDEDQKV